MFCYQCEQSANGKGCTVSGVCGKNPDIAALQDLLVENLKGVAIYAQLAGEMGLADREADVLMTEGLFATVTNVDFDPDRLVELIKKTQEAKLKLKNLFLGAYKSANHEDYTGVLPAVATLVPSTDLSGLLAQAQGVGVMANKAENDDIRSLKQLLIYGLKGMAAYAHHAWEQGVTDDAVFAFFHKGMSAVANEAIGADELVALNMELGQVNLRCMELLDEANTTHFGHPEPTEVSLGVKEGPSILVSGHDLPDLEALLKQTEGKGVNIYTHGEMLPALAYPGLKKYSHLVGNYGGAWQDQQKEFDEFPGAILMTTNCIQKPKATYIDRIFTTGLVAWPGVTHVPDRKDFSKVIEKAIEEGGFKADVPGKKILIGFGRNAVLGVADKVIDAVKAGKIKRFLLVGGCDGAKSGRNYYTELAEKAPKDTVLLTLACGKFRFNKLEFGDIDGIPRLLDIGQCNDAYSAIKIAVALAEAFNVGVNDLPLNLILSWYEQKAVCILLTLLSLGIKNIKIGPSLPAFVSSNVLNVLVEKFALAPIKTADEDLKEIFG